MDHIGPTEVVHLQLRKLYQDFNLVMKDGSWIHFEFQSTDKGLEDLKRFWTYEALTTYQYNVEVRTYVLYSGTIKNPITEFTSGFNTYRVQPIIIKGHLVQDVFDKIKTKLNEGVLLTKEDFVPLMLCPLMSGDISQRDRIRIGFQILRRVENTFNEIEKMEAVLYAMANKFLDEADLNQIKEEIKMTALGLSIYNDGIEQGIEQGIERGSLENAKCFFINGASFELVRNSIKGVSEEKLKQIYDEVMAEKEQ